MAKPNTLKRAGPENNQDCSTARCSNTSGNTSPIPASSSELSLYPYCRERGYALYVNDSIHLKAYSVGLSDAILASGNVSARGMMPASSCAACHRYAPTPARPLVRAAPLLWCPSSGPAEAQPPCLSGQKYPDGTFIPHGAFIWDGIPHY